MKKIMFLSGIILFLLIMSVLYILSQNDIIRNLKQENERLAEEINTKNQVIASDYKKIEQCKLESSYFSNNVVYPIGTWNWTEYYKNYPKLDYEGKCCGIASQFKEGCRNVISGCF